MMKFVFIQTLLALFIVFVLLFLFTNMNFFIQQAFLLFAILVLLILLSMVWPPDSPWSPWWRTSKKQALALYRLANVTKKDVVYELGSGDGVGLLTAAEKYGVKGVGVEIDPVRHGIARLNQRFSPARKRVTFYKQNFFTTDLSEATVVYVYLVPKALERLKTKLLTELKPGTRVISHVYPIPYLPLVTEDKQHQFLLYQVPQKKKTTRSATA